jgi:hypothetical protein
VLWDVKEEIFERGGRFFNSKPRGGSQFWKGCMKSNLLVRGAWNTLLGMGKSPSFGMNSGLEIALWGLDLVDYIIYVNNREVSRVLSGGEINPTFRRIFDTSEITEWEELEAELEGV